MATARTAALKAGVNLEISTATLHSRSEAAVEQRNEKVSWISKKYGDSVGCDGD